MLIGDLDYLLVFKFVSAKQTSCKRKYEVSVKNPRPDNEVDKAQQDFIIFQCNLPVTTMHLLQRLIDNSVFLKNIL